MAATVPAPPTGGEGTHLLKPRWVLPDCTDRLSPVSGSHKGPIHLDRRSPQQGPGNGRASAPRSGNGGETDHRNPAKPHAGNSVDATTRFLRRCCRFSCHGHDPPVCKASYGRGNRMSCPGASARLHQAIGTRSRACSALRGGASRRRWAAPKDEGMSGNVAAEGSRLGRGRSAGRCYRRPPPASTVSAPHRTPG